MIVKPQYVKNEKKQKQRKIILTLIFVLVFIASCLGFYIHKRNQYIPVTYPICDFEQKNIVERLKEPHLETLEINDLHFYGETLNFYRNTYSIFETDDIIGNTAILKNVCDQKNDLVYIINKHVDSQIPLEVLEDGFYELYFQENLVEKRAYSPEVLDTIFTTIQRNNSVKKIEVIANKNLVDDRENQDVMDKHYVFIKVTTIEPEETVYDVVINPNYNDQDNGYTINRGLLIDQMVEANENYQMAVLLKSELEKYGLRVLILRNQEEIVNTYGPQGRLHRAYQSSARYFIDLDMNRSNNRQVDGFEIIYSSFSSPRMAVSLSEYILENTDLKGTTIGKYTGARTFGLAKGYDAHMVIRESGGKALAAASYSENSKENMDFAYNNIYGIQAISIRYGYITNSEFRIKWTNNKQDYARITAEALVKYLQIK